MARSYSSKQVVEEETVDFPFLPVGIIAMIVMIMIGVATVVFSIMAVPRYQNAKAQNEAEATEIQEQIDSLKADIEKSQEANDKAYYSAGTQGQEITTLENRLGEDVSDEEKAEEDKSMIRSYISDDSAVEWFRRATTWRFCTSYNYPAPKIPVFWYLTSEDNVLLAYQSAVFDSDTGKFSGFTLKTTKNGEDALVAAKEQDEKDQATDY